MKLVTAIIKPFKLDDVKAALKTSGCTGLTVSRGPGLRPPARPHRGLPGCGVHGRLRAEGAVEVLVDDADADEVVDTIVEAARTGKIGDGKVWVTPVDTVVRVRTGERGRHAL